MPFASAAVIGGVVAAAGAVGAAAISSNASKNAAKSQANASAAANQEQQREYDQTRADYAPYREAGTNALTHLNGLMADPSQATKDPSYAFGMSQGTQAIDRSAASGGSLYSGATLKALERYGQDYAGTKLNEQYNRYANIAGLGQVATSGTTAAGTNAANQIGNNLTSLGNAQAANSLNQGNIWSNAANQLSSYGKNNNWFGGSGGYQTPTQFQQGTNFYGGSGTTLYGDGYGPG